MSFHRFVQRAADCIDLLKEAVSLCETNEGDDFVSVHHSALRLLSRAQASQKCYQEAKEAMEKAVRIQRRIEDKSIQVGSHEHYRPIFTNGLMDFYFEAGCGSARLGRYIECDEGS